MNTMRSTRFRWVALALTLPMLTAACGTRLSSAERAAAAGAGSRSDTASNDQPASSDSKGNAEENALASPEASGTSSAPAASPAGPSTGGSPTPSPAAGAARPTAKAGTAAPAAPTGGSANAATPGAARPQTSAGGAAAPATPSGGAAAPSPQPGPGPSAPATSVFPTPPDLITKTGSHSQGVTDKELRIGVVAPLSGAAGFLGEREVDAVRAVFSMVNEAGGIRGRQLRMIVGDSQFEPTVEVTATKRLVEQDKVLLLLNVIGDASAPYVTTKGIPNLVWGMAPPAYSSKFPTTHVFLGHTPEWVAWMAYTLKEKLKLPIKSTAILYETNNVPVGPWVKYMVRAWEYFGVEVKSTDNFNLSDGDCTRIVLKMRQLNIDFWQIAQTLAWPACQAAAARQNYNPPQGRGGPYTATKSFVSQAGTAADGVYAQMPGVQIARNTGEPYPYEGGIKAPEVDRYMASMKKYSPTSADLDSLEDVWTQGFWAAAKFMVAAVSAQTDAVTWDGLNTWITQQRNWKSGLVAPFRSFDPKCKQGSYPWIFQWKVVNGKYEQSDWQPYGGPVDLPLEVKNAIFPGAGDCYLTAMADAEL